ncbi:MAG: TatD family hydrolase [Gammaproteobacteria bacterium]|nr:TatD family hydrolase [Gammaproteobacteria bacterium]
MKYIDIGVNLTNRSLIKDLGGVMQRAQDAGVGQMVVTASNIEESTQAIELCRQYPDALVCTVGIHPHHASDWMSHTPQNLQELSENACVRAIGETGLDFNRNYSPRNEQVDAFRAQLELAIALGKPVFAHQRDAHDTFVEILREYRTRLSRIVVHCFTDSRAALLDYLDLDCHIGITGWICDERRGLALQQLVSLIPAQRLMVETDAPYLLPRDLPTKPVSRINEPAYLPHIMHSIARHQHKEVDQLAGECLKTSRLFFGIS